MTVGELIEHWAQRFADQGLCFVQGTDNAWDEATWMVLCVCGLADETASLTRTVSATNEHTINRLAQQRIQSRTPMAYLLGEAYFAGHRFLARPGVIVPRSPIAELIKAEFLPWLTQPPRRILDLCCGSGCIGIAAALAFPGSRVDLVDLDDTALALAAENVAVHQVSDRVQILASDGFARLKGRYDLILCNPPYVDAADMRALPLELAAEPQLALAGGEDGLDLVRALLQAAPEHLATEGWLVLEVGNSAPALLRSLPGVELIWPMFEAGGEGVCLLDYEQTEHASRILSSV